MIHFSREFYLITHTDFGDLFDSIRFHNLNGNFQNIKQTKSRVLLWMIK